MGYAQAAKVQGRSMPGLRLRVACQGGPARQQGLHPAANTLLLALLLASPQPQHLPTISGEVRLDQMHHIMQLTSLQGKLEYIQMDAFRMAPETTFQN